ncbi:MAG TPA: hypothetical protein VM344_00430 [Vitreimonas sp.]|nr:hypothetical protein [Vitreimonas sp.]
MPSLAVATPSLTPIPGRDHITLRIAPANLGCDAVTVAYRQVTFRIDPAAAEQVWAIANTGDQLRTYWSPQFTAGSPDDPVVRAPGGDVLVADGDVLAIPLRAWPELDGYFVCPSRDALYVLFRPPS